MARSYRAAVLAVAQELGGGIQPAFGALMQLAGQEWRKWLAEKEPGAEGGEFSVGPCVVTLVECACTSAQAKIPRHLCDWCCGTGRVTRRVRQAQEDAEEPPQAPSKEPPRLPGEPFPDAKSCPFCGTARITIYRSRPDEKEQWWACCDGCAATGPWQKFRSAAMEQWNLRHRKPYEKPAIVKTLDLVALREKAERMLAVGYEGPFAVDAGGGITTNGGKYVAADARDFVVARYFAAASPDAVLRLLDALDAAERRIDAWRDCVVRYGTHEPGCEAHMATAASELEACDCGYSEALARAEGR